MQRLSKSIVVHCCKFQSMHPIKDATGILALLATEQIFQSMHPIKDATIDSQLIELQVTISIHAPYKGCNSTDSLACDRFGNFNPCTL